MATRCYNSEFPQHQKHVLIKALMKKGYDKFELAWSSRSERDWGWTIVNTSHECREIFGKWLRGSIAEALKEIEKLPNNEDSRM